MAVLSTSTNALALVSSPLPGTQQMRATSSNAVAVVSNPLPGTQQMRATSTTALALVVVSTGSGSGRRSRGYVIG